MTTQELDFLEKLVLSNLARLRIIWFLVHYHNITISPARILIDHIEEN